MSYATLAQFKGAVALGDADDDTNVQRALDAATEWIDGYTGRVFGAVTGSLARVFDAVDPWRLPVPDLATVTAVDIDSRWDGSFVTSLPATSYQLYPLNIGQPGVRGNYRELRIRPNATMGFFPDRQVRVTGTWGYGSVPAGVEECCILLANRYFRRASAPFGIISAPESGELARLPSNDPDVMKLLDEFTSKRWVLV